MTDQTPAVGIIGSRRNSAYEWIYERVAMGDWPVGTKLPSESELAETLAVSRATLREALLRLRIDGIIDSRQGAGSRVFNSPSRSVLDHVPASQIVDLLQCIEFRMALEGEAIHQATQRANASQIAAIEAAMEDMISACNDPALIGDEEDIAFHLAIARATDNSYFESAVAAVIQSVRTGVRIASTLPHQTRDERLRNPTAEHAEMLEAIRQRDAEGARQLMRAHIENARKRVFLGQQHL